MMGWLAIHETSLNCFMSIKNTVAIALLFFAFNAGAQSVDTVIHTDIYTSHFNNTLHEPLYVVYKLYDGGGDCDRKAFHFKTNGLPYSAKPADYKGNGFDEGHLADAKDFAFDCLKEEETFRFYNCVPQTPRLNRGIWKYFETAIRKESQSDSLLIICGSIFGNKTIGPDSIAVPEYCWKIVYSLTTKEIIHCMLFPNDDSDTYTDIDIDNLKKRLGYPLVY
jgi:endonuclease G, mitochondrial